MLHFNSFLLIAIMASAATLAEGCAEGCPIVCDALEHCPDECKTSRSSAAAPATDGFSETSNGDASFESSGDSTGHFDSSSGTSDPLTPTTTGTIDTCNDPGAPFGPCDAGTCSEAAGYNSFCLHGDLGNVCVPVCSKSCPSACDVVSACEAGACRPVCDDGTCPGTMLCDASVGACVHPF